MEGGSGAKQTRPLTGAGLTLVGLSYLVGLAALFVAFTGIGHPYPRGDSGDMATNSVYDQWSSDLYSYAFLATFALNTIAIVVGIAAVKKEPKTEHFFQPHSPIVLGAIGYIGTFLLFLLGALGMMAYA